MPNESGSPLPGLDGVVVESKQADDDRIRTVHVGTDWTWVGVCPQCTVRSRRSKGWVCTNEAGAAARSTSSGSIAACADCGGMRYEIHAALPATPTTNAAAYGGPAPAEHGESHPVSTSATADPQTRNPGTENGDRLRRTGSRR